MTAVLLGHYAQADECNPRPRNIMRVVLFAVRSLVTELCLMECWGPLHFLSQPNKIFDDVFCLLLQGLRDSIL